MHGIKLLKIDLRNGRYFSDFIRRSHSFTDGLLNILTTRSYCLKKVLKGRKLLLWALNFLNLLRHNSRAFYNFDGRLLFYFLTKVIGKAVSSCKVIPILRLGCTFLFFHSASHAWQIQSDLLILILLYFACKFEARLINLMVLKAICSQFSCKHMTKHLVIHSHLKTTLMFSNIEETPFNNEGMVVRRSLKSALLSLMEYFSVNGQLRFATHQRIIHDKVKVSLSDAEWPKVSLFCGFDMFTNLLHLELQCSYFTFHYIRRFDYSKDKL